MEWYAAYLALGAVAGFLAGLFGIGGGAILVPVLLFLFDAQSVNAEHVMHLALGTSMATIVFTSLASTRKHHMHGAVQWRVVRDITPGILIGTALGAAVAAIISARGLGILFAVFVYFIAAQMLLDKRPAPSRQLPGFVGMTAMGTFTGWISTLVSIGGGTVIVPFLVWCNTPLRQAIATSAAVGFPVALGGTVGYLWIGQGISNLPEASYGYVYLPALFWVAIATILTAPLGAKAAHRLKVEVLRKLFAVLLLVLATKLLFKVVL